MSKATCPTCGNEYKQLGNHWQFSEDHRPEYTDDQMEIINGLLMGDGCLADRDGNPYLTISMGVKEFLEWLDGYLGIHSTGVTLSYTAQDLAERNENDENIPVVNAENYHHQYRMNLRKHPQLRQFTHWYDSGSKIFPEDIEFTPLSMKMWYVSDGVLGWGKTDTNPRVQIRLTDRQECADTVVDLLEDEGFSPNYSSGHLYFRVGETEDLLDWMGDAPPGFEYKWCTSIKDEYDTLKDGVLYQ